MDQEFSCILEIFSGKGKEYRANEPPALGEGSAHTTPPLSLSPTQYVNVDINENHLKPETCSMHCCPNITGQAIGDVNSLPYSQRVRE